MSKTILLADDSVTIRKVVELTFMEESYELVSFGGGDEAIGQLATLDPDLVIADIHMPGVTGYEVCRAAKELRPERPVLLLIGTFEPFDEDEIEASSADGHLKKPFDSQELLRTVRELLAGAEAVTASDVADPDAAAAAAADSGLEASDAGGDSEALEAVGAVEAVEEISEPGTDEDVPAGAALGESTESAAAAPPQEVAGNGEGRLSDETVERIARRVAEILGPEVVRDVAWEVVPDLAEVVIKERLRELESQVE